MNRPTAVRHAHSGASRLKRFIEIEKTQGAEGSHPAARALHARAAARDVAARVREFVRIARGRTA